jgi:hypothetical protein
MEVLPSFGPSRANCKDGKGLQCLGRNGLKGSHHGEQQWICCSLFFTAACGLSRGEKETRYEKRRVQVRDDKRDGIRATHRDLPAAARVRALCARGSEGRKRPSLPRRQDADQVRGGAEASIGGHDARSGGWRICSTSGSSGPGCCWRPKVRIR